MYVQILTIETIAFMLIKFYFLKRVPTYLIKLNSDNIGNSRLFNVL